MKTKNISILLFILAFVGVAMFAYTEVGAACPGDSWGPSPTYNCLGDGVCETAEANSNLCIESYPYTIELLPDPSGAWWTVVYPGDDSNCTDPNGCKRWMYRGCIPPMNCKGVNAWSHLTMVLELCGESTIDAYIVNTDPSPQIFGGPGNDENSCNIVVEDDEEFLKFEPTLKCNRNGKCVDFAVYATMDSSIDCSAFMGPKYGQSCGGGNIVAPGCGGGDLGLFETTRIIGFNDAILTYDICTRDIQTVTFPGEPDAVEGKAWICWDGNPFDSNATTADCHEQINSGPQYVGCYIQLNPECSSLLYRGTASTSCRSSGR
jgi:hypothetical protein